MTTRPSKPLAAEDVLHEEDVARGRDAVIVVEGGHQRERAGLHGRLERREVHIPQLAFRQERAVVVPPAFRGAVAGEMLDAGRHRRGVRQVALIAADHRLGHLGIQPGVLSASFRDAAPARVPRDVQHRREGPSDPLPGRLDGGHAGARLHEGGVEGRRQPQRNGENRVEPVDDVPAHEERNPETGLLHADALELIDLDGVHLVQDGPDLALAEGVGIVGHLAAGGDLVHLADLLGQGHPGKELVHPALHLGRSPHGGGFALGAGEGRRQQGRHEKDAD